MEGALDGINTNTKHELFWTHSGPFYPVALPQTQVRFVPDSIDNPRLDLRTVEQSVPDLVTLPLLCESSDKSIADSGSILLSATSPQHSLSPQIPWLLLPPAEVRKSTGVIKLQPGATFQLAKLCKVSGLLQQY